MVRLRGLEPLPVSGMEPKSIVYTNFTTGAYEWQGRPAVIMLKKTFTEITVSKSWMYANSTMSAQIAHDITCCQKRL